MSVCRECRGCGETIASTTHGRQKWCSERCRKLTLYGVNCADCGTRIRGDGSQPAKRCAPCASAHRSDKTRELIIEAIRDWYNKYGTLPSATEWRLTPSSRSKMSAELWSRTKDRHAERNWPRAATVQYAFGSWSAAVAAAGFAPRAHGSHGSYLRVEMRRARIRDLWLAGRTGVEISVEVGATAASVYQNISAMRKAGSDLPYRTAAGKDGEGK